MVEVYKKMRAALVIPVICMIVVSMGSLSYSSFKQLSELDNFLRDQYIDKERQHLEKNIVLYQDFLNKEMSLIQQLNQTMDNYFSKIQDGKVNFLNGINLGQGDQKQQNLENLFTQIQNDSSMEINKYIWQKEKTDNINDIFNSSQPDMENLIYKQLKQYLIQLQVNNGFEISELLQEQDFGIVYTDFSSNEQYDNFNELFLFFMGNQELSQSYTEEKDFSSQNCFIKGYCFKGQQDSIQYLIPYDSPQKNYARLGVALKKNVQKQQDQGLGVELFASISLEKLYNTLQEKYNENQVIYKDFDKNLNNKILEEVVMFQNNQDKSIFLYYQDYKSGNSSSTSRELQEGEQNQNQKHQKHQKNLKEFFDNKFTDKNKDLPNQIMQEIDKMIKEIEQSQKDDQNSNEQKIYNYTFSTEENAADDDDEKWYYLYLIPVFQQGEIQGYITLLKQKKVLIFPFVTTFDKLNYIKYIIFFVIFLLSGFITFMAYRHSHRLALGVFQQPLQDVKNILELIENNDNDEQWDYDEYQTNFTCNDVRILISSILSLVKDIKFSNQLFSKNDATSLLRLSKAKLRYNHSDNLSGVGICCNNIGNIHLKNGRYSEAVSEYQESILMAKIEYKEHNQMIYSQYISKSPFKSQYDQIKKRRKSKNLIEDSQHYQYIDYVQEQYNNNYQQQQAYMQLNNTEDENNNINLNNNQDQNESSSMQNNNQNNINNGYSNNGNQKQQPEQILKEDQLDIKLYNYFPECETLIHNRNKAKINMLNRKYQLGVALYFYGSKDQDVNLLPQAIELFSQCLKISKTQKLDKRSNLVRHILILQQQAFCYVKLLEIKEAQRNLESAKRYFQDLIQYQTNEYQIQHTDFLDIFDNIPNDVIEQYILYTDAWIELLNFNFQRARDVFTTIIRSHQKYDTNIRENTLKILQSIFNECLGSDAADIMNPYLQKFNLKTIDMIFLIDYSRIMQEEQIRRAHIIARHVLKELQPNDKLGQVAFNESIHEFFQLQHKKQYLDLLEKKVRTIMLAPGGSADLYKALKETSKFFEKQHGIKMEQEDEEIRKGIKARYLVLISEGDYKWTKEKTNEIKKLFEKKQIRLLVTNISQQNQNMLYLQELTAELKNPESEFFSADGKIPEYISQLRERNTRQQLIYEYLS